MEGVERGSDVVGWWEGVSKELGNGREWKGGVMWLSSEREELKNAKETIGQGQSVEQEKKIYR